MTRSLGYAPVAFLAAGAGSDSAEFTHAWQAVLARGGQPVLVSPVPREIDPMRTFGRVGQAGADVQVQDASAASFAGLVLPGGIVHAEQLWVQPSAVGFVRDFFAAGLPVAAMCCARPAADRGRCDPAPAADFLAEHAQRPVDRRRDLCG